jgi:hypothetical protein
MATDENVYYWLWKICFVAQSDNKDSQENFATAYIIIVALIKAVKEIQTHTDKINNI